MSYFNKQQAAGSSNKKPSQQATKKPLPNNNKKPQETGMMNPKLQDQEAQMLKFTNDEVVFIENVLVKLEDLIPNDMNENQEILEMIVTCQQIISARLDNEAGYIGDSA